MADFFEDSAPAQLQADAHIRAKVVHALIARLQNVVFVDHALKVGGLILGAIAQLGREGTHPAGGQSAVRMDIAGHFVQQPPEGLADGHHAVENTGFILHLGVEFKIRKMDKTVVVNIQIAQVFDLVAVDPDLGVMQVLNPFAGQFRELNHLSIHSPYFPSFTLVQVAFRP